VGAGPIAVACVIACAVGCDGCVGTFKLCGEDEIDNWPPCDLTGGSGNWADGLVGPSLEPSALVLSCQMVELTPIELDSYAAWLRE
jgi:hypothetical protein